jgi:hypothetical protein
MFFLFVWREEMSCGQREEARHNNITMRTREDCKHAERIAGSSHLGHFLSLLLFKAWRKFVFLPCPVSYGRVIA